MAEELVQKRKLTQRLKVRPVLDRIGERIVPESIFFMIHMDRCPHANEKLISRYECHEYQSCRIIGRDYQSPSLCPYCKGIENDDFGNYFVYCEI